MFSRASSDALPRVRYNKEHENVTHLITFADNNAVGYFQKQGFTKEILLEREKWAGYIKARTNMIITSCAESDATMPPFTLPRRSTMAAR